MHWCKTSALPTQLTSENGMEWCGVQKDSEFVMTWVGNSRLSFPRSHCKHAYSLLPAYLNGTNKGYQIPDTRSIFFFQSSHLFLKQVRKPILDCLFQGLTLNIYSLLLAYLYGTNKGYLSHLQKVSFFPVQTHIFKQENLCEKHELLAEIDWLNWKQHTITFLHQVYIFYFSCSV